MAFVDPAVAEKAEKLKTTLKTIELDGEKLFIAEGDLLLREHELVEYVPKAANEELPNLPTDTAGHGLVGIVDDSGRIERWAPGVVLAYCVLRRTFLSDDEYQTARAAVLQATGEWEQTCGVAFQHRSDLDNASERPPEVVFAVRRVDVHGAFIAAAFFPRSPVAQRFVNIDGSFYAPNLLFDRVGVLRHELGHVLGFRHEHIVSQAPAACPDESLGNTIRLSDYDPRSVMHYFCGGVGSKALAITDVDIVASRSVYGPPLARFHFLTP